MIWTKNQHNRRFLGLENIMLPRQKNFGEKRNITLNVVAVLRLVCRSFDTAVWSKNKRVSKPKDYVRLFAREFAKAGDVT